MELTKINSDQYSVNIQLPGFDFSKQLSTQYPSSFFFEEGRHSMELNKINSDQSSVNIQLPGDC